MTLHEYVTKILQLYEHVKTLHEYNKEENVNI